MLLCAINDSILIISPYYSGVYQDEANIGALQRDKYIFGVGTKPKKMTKRCCLFLRKNMDFF